MVRRAGWLVAAALVAGCATDNSVGGSSQIGKVQGVYVEQYDGMFLDRQLATTGDAGKPLWVYVTFDRPLKDGSRFATAILEQDSGVETGDLVQLRFAHAGEPQSETIPAHHQVIGLVAKHDTARARAFGSAPAPAVETLKQAAVDKP
jgi:hypothetical protein